MPLSLKSYTRKYCALIADNAPMTMSTLKRTVTEVLRGHEADWEVCNKLVEAMFCKPGFR